jgi:hypothetical protein
MEVSEALTFDQYWANREFRDKRPIRNGSRVMMVGDNIYHHLEGDTGWYQLDSHHSLPDGSPNPLNVERDTGVNRVLISRKFFYFGAKALLAPSEMLRGLRFRNGIGHRVFDAEECGTVLEWITSHRNAANTVLADPFNFDESEKRYAGRGSAVA